MSAPVSPEEKLETAGRRNVGRVAIRTVVSLAIGAFFLWLAVRGMRDAILAENPDARPGTLILGALSAVSLFDVVVYTLLFGIVHYLRAWRWVVQLRPLGLSDRRFGMNASFVGLAAIAVLPLRLGEFLRPALVTRTGEVDYSSALGTSVVERVIDGLVVSLCVFLAVQLAPGQVDTIVLSAGWGAFVLFAGVGGALVLFSWRPMVVVRLLTLLVAPISKRLADGLAGLLESFTRGARSLLGAGTFWAYLFGTLLYWFLNGVGVWWWLHVFGFDVSIFAGVAIVSVLVIGIMIPAGPGFLGNFQLFLLAGLSMWLTEPLGGDAAARAFACALSLNLLQLVIQVIPALPPLFVDKRLQLGPSD